MTNIRIRDNGAAFLIEVNGIITSAHDSLGNAWRHINWMYRIASQEFTVGELEIPVKEWLEKMKKCGCI